MNSIYTYIKTHTIDLKEDIYGKSVEELRALPQLKYYTFVDFRPPKKDELFLTTGYTPEVCLGTYDNTSPRIILKKRKNWEKALFRGIEPRDVYGENLEEVLTKYGDRIKDFRMVEKDDRYAWVAWDGAPTENIKGDYGSPSKWIAFILEEEKD